MILSTLQHIDFYVLCKNISTTQRIILLFTSLFMFTCFMKIWFEQGIWKVIPAIAAGCTVVLKPSELAPLSCLILAEMCTSAGCPDGAINVVTGLGPDAGGPLTSHPDIDKVSIRSCTSYLD